MTDNDAAAEKRIVDQLSLGAKTSKRVTWEAWSFRIVGPHQVEVCNESHGYLKDDHTYTVGVEVRGGLALPAECDCPADKYREDDACKHKVALATVGGPTVLDKAVEFETRTTDAPTEPETMSDKLKAYGGTLNQREGNECDCASLSDDFPCWPCVRDGKRKLPEQGGVLAFTLSRDATACVFDR